MAVSMATLESKLGGFTRQVVGALPFVECVRLHSANAPEQVSYEGADGTPQFPSHSNGRF